MLSSGHVECWGDHELGALGNGTTTEAATPVEGTNLDRHPGEHAGKEHTCAMLTTGDVECWGYNGDGELGNGTTTDAPCPSK